jgi:DNA polymerase III epsilon subunit-like protein
MLLKVIYSDRNNEYYSDFISELLLRLFNKPNSMFRAHNYYIDTNKGIINADNCDSLNLYTINEFSKAYSNLSFFVYTSGYYVGSDDYTGDDYEVFGDLWCLFKKGQCSHLFLDNRPIDEKLWPALNDYVVYSIRENIDDTDFIPSYFNEFESSEKLFEKLEKLNFGCFFTKEYPIFYKSVIWDLFNSRECYHSDYPEFLGEYPKAFDNKFILSKDVDKGYISTDKIDINYNIPPDFLYSPTFTNQSFISDNVYTIIIDCETNGLPSDFNKPFPYYYPEIVQLSWAIYDNKNRLIKVRNYIVKPVGYQISKESTKIHGIKHISAQAFGTPIHLVINSLSSDLSYCDLIVGHNLEYDIKAITSNFYHQFSRIQEYGIEESDFGFFFPYKEKLRKFCTMKDSVQLVSDGDVKKWYKLEELYKYLFAETATNCHNSLNDIWYTSRCYFEIAGRLSKMGNLNLEYLDIGYENIK